MPALSDQSQTDKVTVSWADNKFMRYFLAFCRAEREREPATLHGSTTTRPLSSRLKSQECLGMIGYAAKQVF